MHTITCYEIRVKKCILTYRVFVMCACMYVCICSRNEDNPSASTLISDEVLQMMSGRSSRQSCRDEREMVRVR